MQQMLKELSHLPVIADPSHAVGVHRHVGAVALAGVAAGADGLIIETHPDPDNAISDGDQSLTLPQFGELMVLFLSSRKLFLSSRKLGSFREDTLPAT